MAVEAWHAARTLRVLELLAFQPLSAPQLAAALDAHPRTVRRVLGRLADDDYVIQEDDPRRRYHPTMRLVAMAGQVLANSELVDRARPYVVLLHERTGAAAHLVMPSYDSVVCVTHCDDGGETERARLRELVPAHCTAGGKVLLAWRDRWRDSLLVNPLHRFTNRTITDSRALRAELDVIRDRGYADEDGEYVQRRRAVAAPVVMSDDVMAALVIDGRSVSDSARDAVVRTAAQLSTNLTGRP
jgi:DNA-binding IclR family transcriptional regulator